MKRILTTALLASSLLLALSVAASAAPWHEGAATGGKGGTEQQSRLRMASMPGQTVEGAGFVPLGAALSGTAELNGHCYWLYGDGSPEWPYVNYPQSGTTVTWSVSSPEGSGRGTTLSDIEGAFAMSGVAPAAGTGIVSATDRLEEPEGPYPDTLSYVGRTWADGSISTYDFRPGVARVNFTMGGPFHSYEQGSAWWSMRGTDAGGGIESYTPQAGSQEDIDVRLHALPGTYTDVCVNFWSNEGVEKATSFTVSSAAETSTGLTLNETSAQRLWEVSRYTASGDPGSVVKLRLQNFPAGEVTDFSGYQYEPMLTPLKSFGSFTARNLANQYKNVTIPVGATPGQDYVIAGHHRDGLLDLRAYFQVTRLNGPSSASGAYRLNGQVPIQSYDGSPADTGASKYVYLYRRYTAAGQPKGDPLKYGWKFVRRYRTGNTGKFITASMNPGRDVWYVVFYGEDRDNWPGFTSVRRVRHK